METEARLFLQALQAALRGETVTWDEIAPEQWQQIFRLAQIHHVLPMIFQAVRQCPAAQAMDPALLAEVRKSALHLVMLQAKKAFAFFPMYREMEAAGVPPLVVKGAVCRELYPQPDQRISGDEDLLIPPEQFRDCMDVILRNDMRVMDPSKDPESSYEVSFCGNSSPLHIELHRSLFAAESKAYGHFNDFFRDAFARSQTQEIQGTVIRTLCPTDHMLYLILHAFKHFLHSGFGIRQVCDISLFANAYGSQIDWDYVAESCTAIRAEQFTAALFRIGQNYLTLDPVAANLPRQLSEAEVDELPLLEDLLSGGAYGSASENRIHSSNMTLHAVSKENSGGKQKGGVRRSLFPPAKSLRSSYPYLKKMPFLLPVAWASRIVTYSSRHNTEDALESIRIGNQRIELLQHYGIIDHEK